MIAVVYSLSMRKAEAGETQAGGQLSYTVSPSQGIN